MYGKTRTTTVILLSLVLLISGCVSEAVYHPAHNIRSTPADIKLAYEDIAFETSDGVMLTGWWVPAAEPEGTVLFCHGNAGNIGDRLDTLQIINTLGLNVLIFDYRGYGRSDGSPTEEGTYLDAEAAWDYLVTKKNVAPHQIIVWGRSLGGAIAARTAANHRAGVVIVESTFTSLKDLADDLFVWVPSWLLTNYAYDTAHYLENLDVPVLVIHSRDDEIIPFHHGKRLYGSIKGPKAFLEIQGSHNRGFIDCLAEYAPSINDFIDQYARKKGAVQK
jgi:fermentation-respiration switch protein FrsA (DUF1100 family)